MTAPTTTALTSCSSSLGRRFLLGGSGEFSLDAVLARLGTSAARSGEPAIDRRSALRRAERGGWPRSVRSRAWGSRQPPRLPLLEVLRIDGARRQRRQPRRRRSELRLPRAPEARPTTSSPSGEEIGLASAIPVGGALAFTDQTRGIPAYCVHKSAGEFVAFSAICTHAGCTVGFDQSAAEFVCPCHGSIYNALTGAVIQGPAPLPLPRDQVSNSHRMGRCTPPIN